MRFYIISEKIDNENFRPGVFRKKASGFKTETHSRLNN